MAAILNWHLIVCTACVCFRCTFVPGTYHEAQAGPFLHPTKGSDNPPFNDHYSILWAFLLAFIYQLKALSRAFAVAASRACI